MTLNNTVQQTLQEDANRRYQQFAPTSIATMLTHSSDFSQVSRYHLQHLIDNRQEVLDWFDLWSADSQVKMDTLRFFIQHTTDYIHTKNQYVEIPPDCQSELLRLYHHFLVDYRHVLQSNTHQETLDEAIITVHITHHHRLAAFIHELAQRNGNLRFVLSEPTCYFYSSETQLAKLHLTLDDLVEPILDLGCGQHGQLVHYLRSQGKRAHGIDRMAHTTSHIKRMSWFDFDGGDQQWGTILSHMAFSNHFRHHHLRQGSDYVRYAQTFMALLQALKPGGSFIYAPGLPFIESLLSPAQYAVIQFGTGNTNDSSLYASHVMRLY